MAAVFEKFRFAINRIAVKRLSNYQSYNNFKSYVSGNSKSKTCHTCCSNKNGLRM